MTVAALYVREDGPYSNREGVEVWGITRDARKYAGPHKVIAHPPCERWGRYWSGGPKAKKRRKLGDDKGCFKAALASVRAWGGVLEHPEASRAFRMLGLGVPPLAGGWVKSRCGTGWICNVEQGHYGHAARKPTWLYYVGAQEPPPLIWGPSVTARKIEGMSRRQRADTPEPFLQLLLSLVK